MSADSVADDPRRDPVSGSVSSSPRTHGPMATPSDRRSPWRWRCVSSARHVHDRRPRSRAAAVSDVSRRPRRSRCRQRVEGEFDAAIVMECGDLSRTGVEGLDKYFVINIDHHPGNTTLRRDQLVRRRGGRLRRDGVRRHRGARRHADAGDRDAYLHHDPDRHRAAFTSRTSRRGRSRSAGAAPRPARSRKPSRGAVYDSSTMGRLRLMGAVLHSLEFESGGRVGRWPR